MNQPADPLDSTHHTESQPPAIVPDTREPISLSLEENRPQRIFPGSDIPLGFRILLYFGLVFAIARLLGWFGPSLFPDSAGGAIRLWQELYGECAAAAAALIAAVLMARIEERSVDVYGLPRAQAFGRWFWIGAAWGLVWITVLLLFLHSAHVFEFGGLALHGKRILRFALFWGVNFVAVGLFEEFLLRGYFQFVLTERVGFWPTAIFGSLVFGGIHLFNKDETLVGALGAGLIGLFFCLTLRRTGTLWFAVGFHAAWDWGESFLYGVPDSGTQEAGHLLTPRFHGNHWITGGSVGPEASVLLLVVLAAMWFAFDRSYRAARYGLRS